MARTGKAKDEGAAKKPSRGEDSGGKSPGPGPMGGGDSEGGGGDRPDPAPMGGGDAEPNEAAESKVKGGKQK